MLADKEMFNMIEGILRDNGSIARFESENGSIQGRVMITMVDIPEELQIESIEN